MGSFLKRPLPKKVLFLNGIYEHPLYLARWQDRFRCPLPIKLNPYLGCSGGCSYCFSAQMRKPNQPDRYNEVWPGSVDFLKNKLEQALNGSKNKSYLHKCLRQRIPIQVGVLCDPFQPAEKKYHITKQMIEVLHEYSYPFLLITKFNVPDSYLELLSDCECVVHVSLSTLDNAFIKKTEKNTPSSNERIKNIAKLCKHDIPVQHRHWPIWPLLTDEPQELFKKVSDAGASDVIAGYIRLFNFKRFLPVIDKVLGFNYLDYLKKNGYPMVKDHDYFRVEPNKMLKEYYKFQDLADGEGLGFFTPDMLGFNEGKGCCGTDHLLGLGATWALNVNVDCFENETTFNEYMVNSNCPYKKQFKKFWDKNGVNKAISDIECINKNNKSYKIIKQQELV